MGGKVVLFSYVGTGKCGLGHDVSITFDAPPKLIYIIGYYRSDFGSFYNSYHPNTFFSLDKIGTEYTQICFTADWNYSSDTYVKKSSDGKSVSWNNDPTWDTSKTDFTASTPRKLVDSMFNNSNTTYYGIAFF